MMNKSSTSIVVLVTAKDADEAQKIAHQLVEHKIVACANIIKDVESIFWWEKKVDQASEALIVLKTTQDRFKDLTEVVKSVHSYDVPEIIALPIVEGSQEYLRWINDSVK